MEILNKRFIIETDGTKDLYYDLLGSCFQQCLYLCAKCENEEQIKKDFYNLFVDDINLTIEWDENTPIKNFNANFFDSCLKAFDISYFKKTGANAKKLLERLLDEGRPVSISTVMDQANFSTRYDPEFVYTGLRPGHIFTVAAHDEDYFYISDDIDFMQPDMVKTYPGNTGIFMVKKEYFEKPFGSYFYCWTSKIDFEKVQKEFYDTTHMRSFLSNTASSYKMKDSVANGCNILCGRNAIVHLIKMCNSECFNTQTSNIPDTDISVYGQMVWQLGYLYNNRIIFLEFLKRNFRRIYENRQFREVFENALQPIILLKNILIKRHMKNLFLLDNEVEKYLLNWLECDDILFKAFEDLDFYK